MPIKFALVIAATDRSNPDTRVVRLVVGDHFVSARPSLEIAERPSLGRVGLPIVEPLADSVPSAGSDVPDHAIFVPSSDSDVELLSFPVHEVGVLRPSIVLPVAIAAQSGGHQISLLHSVIIPSRN